MHKKIVAVQIPCTPVYQTQSRLDQQLREAVEGIAFQKGAALNSIKQLLERGANPDHRVKGVSVAVYFENQWQTLWETLTYIDSRLISPKSIAKKKQEKELEAQTLLIDIFMHLSVHRSYQNQLTLYSACQQVTRTKLKPKAAAVERAKAKAAGLYIEKKDVATSCLKAFISGVGIKKVLDRLTDTSIHLRLTNGATLLHLTALVEDPKKRQQAVDCLLEKGAQADIRMNGGYTYKELLIFKTPPEQRNTEVKWQYNYVPPSIFTRLLLEEWPQDRIDTPQIVAFNQRGEGLDIRQTPARGEAVFANRAFQVGDIVCSFKGFFQSDLTMSDPNVDYAFALEKGLHLSPFRDAGAVCVSWAKVNDGLSNVRTAIMGFDVFFIAIQPISPGEEIEWFYGHAHSLRRNPNTRYIVSESSQARFDHLIQTHGGSIKSYIVYCHQQLQQGTLTPQDLRAFQWILWSPLMDKQNLDLVFTALEFLRIHQPILGEHRFFFAAKTMLVSQVDKDSLKIFAFNAIQSGYTPLG